VNWQLRRYDDAASFFERISNENHSPYGWLWLQVANLKLGKALTYPGAAQPARNIWPQPIVSFYQGDITEEELFKAVEETDASGGEVCEANFYAGEWRLLHGDTAGAQALIQKAADSCPKTHPEYRMAKFEKAKLQ
jgi:lipoprotein NlpI